MELTTALEIATLAVFLSSFNTLANLSDRPLKKVVKRIRITTTRLQHY